MPKPDGYVLSEKDLVLLREVIHKFKRLQHYTNPFGRPPDNTIDNEEMPSTDIYIARSPEDGIAGLTPFSSTGIADVPGKAICKIFKIDGNSEETDIVTDYELLVYNLNTVPVDGNTWVIISRDKYGQWYAVQSFTSTTPTPSLLRGPGWTAGLSNEDCLTLTVTEKIGKCSTVPTQTIYLTSGDGVTWTSTKNFVYSGGAGTVSFTRTAGQSLPTLTIAGKTLIYEGSGITVADGPYYIDFKGGTALCSDGEGTGSGTGGARGACGSNTFTVRLTCSECGIPVDCCITERPEGLSKTLYVSLGSGYGTVTLTWDGVYWSGGSFTVPAGSNGCLVNTIVNLRYKTNCMLQRMCGASGIWGDCGVSFLIVIDCGPPFIATGYEIWGASSKLGCGVCTTGINAVVSE